MSVYTILVAIDFSNGSIAALRWAIDFADKSNANLKIVHVTHDPADAPGTYKRARKDILKPMTEIAQEQFDAFLEKMVCTFPNSTALRNAEILLVAGLPAKRIVSVAKKTEANHIVLGCLGESKIPSAFVGSVALRVLKKSPMPVTIIKAKTKKKKRKGNNNKNSKD